MKTSGGPDKALTRLQLVDLPPFPAVAVRALQLVSRSDTRLHDLHELIRTDPAFAGEILKLANSPLYGIRAEIGSTLQATMLLGFERVKGLALTVGMRAYIGDSFQLPVIRACWRHSLACAMVAEEIAEINQIDKDLAYTAALLHDIGRLALAVMQPLAYNELIENPSVNCGCIIQHERELFGMDHCHAGRLLVTAWRLPEEFLEVTSQHHATFSQNRPDLLGVIGLSCRMADALGFGFCGVDESRVYKTLLGELSESGHKRLPAEPEEFTARIAEKMKCVESIEHPNSDRAEPKVFHSSRPSAIQELRPTN
jgi:putative nucleotidyltransferase with HDIG domain